MAWGRYICSLTFPLSSWWYIINVIRHVVVAVDILGNRKIIGNIHVSFGSEVVQDPGITRAVSKSHCLRHAGAFIMCSITFPLVASRFRQKLHRGFCLECIV